MPPGLTTPRRRLALRWTPILAIVGLIAYLLWFETPNPLEAYNASFKHLVEQEPDPNSALNKQTNTNDHSDLKRFLPSGTGPPKIHPAFKGDPPHSGVYCKMVNDGDFESGWFRQTEEWNGGVERRHRKQWEMAYIPYVIDQLGLCRPGKRGMVFATGQEPLPSLFACHGGCRILATDFDPGAAARAGWTSTGQWAGRKDELFKEELCPSDREFEERVEYRTMDMNKIDPELQGKFDFVWSTCSVEHVGSILLGQRFIINSMDLLKPGGVAIHTVEFTISDLDETIESGATVLWRKKDIQSLLSSLSSLGHHPFPLSWAAGTAPLDLNPDSQPYKQTDHLKLIHEQGGRKWIMTSFAIVVRKAGGERPG